MSEAQEAALETTETDCLSGPGPAAPRAAGPSPFGQDVPVMDLEIARAAVARLSAASTAYPGIGWAIAVARGASGLRELWVTTNEGAGYIPPGVYLPRSLLLVAGQDPQFDARWFGWLNPAETVLRAIRARGDTVSAIATTWPHESEEVNDTVPNVVIGAAPAAGSAATDASHWTPERSHRLETVDPALFEKVSRGDPAVVDHYCCQLARQVVFEGPHLSDLSETVAQTMFVSGRWPSVRDWRALRSEYAQALVKAASRRPGLLDVEDPAQLIAYRRDFVQCRRLETLLCLGTETLADVAYAARAAGVLNQIEQLTQLSGA